MIDNRTVQPTGQGQPRLAHCGTSSLRARRRPGGPEAQQVQRTT
ncbi:MAG: hypothetical protein Q4G40_08935 [Brachybacterium sp.]|nr:hypothetical protein [Brachybacterium sp.]